MNNKHQLSDIEKVFADKLHPSTENAEQWEMPPMALLDNALAINERRGRRNGKFYPLLALLLLLLMVGGIVIATTYKEHSNQVTSGDQSLAHRALSKTDQAHATTPNTWTEKSSEKISSSSRLTKQNDQTNESTLSLQRTQVPTSSDGNGLVAMKQATQDAVLSSPIRGDVRTSTHSTIQKKSTAKSDAVSNEQSSHTYSTLSEQSSTGTQSETESLSYSTALSTRSTYADRSQATAMQFLSTGLLSINHSSKSYPSITIAEPLLPTLEKPTILLYPTRLVLAMDHRINRIASDDTGISGEDTYRSSLGVSLGIEHAINPRGLALRASLAFSHVENQSSYIESSLFQQSGVMESGAEASYRMMVNQKSPLSEVSWNDEFDITTLDRSEEIIFDNVIANDESFRTLQLSLGLQQHIFQGNSLGVYGLTDLVVSRTFSHVNMVNAKIMHEDQVMLDKDFVFQRDLSLTDWMVAVQLGLGGNYHLSPRTALYAETQYLHGLSSLSTLPSDARLQGFNLRLGIKVNL